MTLPRRTTSFLSRQLTKTTPESEPPTTQLCLAVLRALREWEPSEQPSPATSATIETLLHNDIRLSRTAGSRKVALWLLRGNEPYIEAAIAPSRDPHVTAPQFLQVNGTDLATARERYPEHADLWDTVRADYWAAVLNEVGLHRTAADG
ncbi:hypothetical protein [Nocardia sp. alder85J]|uniref:hypothetical protein n=1 Tax=Nocardia sp. alder85J TaxID=2862949 RepID=UPI001CD429B6|nr:hypothetical protein [Nocardia sp. alder85J]MCX4094666.1 hypothetical protein [Nocardia sp. alder85J]